jgi:hypothetical protein
VTRNPCANADGTPKWRFYSEHSALREARWASHGRTLVTLHVYRCPASGRRAHWHVGHTIPEDVRLPSVSDA